MQHKKTVFLLISDLVDYEAQPYKVIDDAAMDELVDSVKRVGVLIPIIVRPLSGGKYEIISGHRRKRACEIAGIKEIPATVRQLTDDEAAILLVDSNLQREKILPSERAYAYRLKLEAIKHQGKTLGQNVRKSGSADIIGAVDDKSGRQIRRYIRLTELIDTLLQKVDDGVIPVTVGTELSYLSVKWQVEVNEILDRDLCSISLKQALKIKFHYMNKTLTESIASEILTETC